MELNNIITVVVGIGVSILGYFFKETVNNLKELEKQLASDLKHLQSKVNDNTTRIRVLENNHTNLDNKIDGIIDAIKDLSKDVKELNRK
ncbi:MAG: hypothetical protein ACRCS4_04140 [Flavobacterium sp.]